MSTRIDRLQHCTAWSQLYHRYSPGPADAFLAELYDREGTHILASLLPEELGRVMSRRYERHLVPEYDRLLAATHGHLQRRAIAVLGERGGARQCAADPDPYVMWVHAQLDLFADFLDGIDPRTPDTRKAIERVSRRIRLDRILPPADAARPIEEVATHLQEQVQVWVGLYWCESADTRDAMLACDLRTPRAISAP